MSNRPASGSPGLSSVANAIHKNNDLSKMSEEEQLEMVMKESRANMNHKNQDLSKLSEEEQLEIVMKESKSKANVKNKIKNKDLSKLTEAEQLELVMKESKIDALSPEEQYEKALRESLALVQTTEPI